jgi:hypothetical protein
MKKLYILLVVSALFLITCKKIPELKIYNLEISEESVTTTSCDAIITAKYSFPTEIYDIKVLVNNSNDMDNAVFVDAALENNMLTATISNLVPSTNYYYCFRYSNSINLVDTDTKTFKTQDASLPSVTTNEVTNITMTTATCGGNVTSDGGANVTARGVCWNTEHNPTTSNSHTSDGTGTGNYTSSLTDLTPNTTYYVRAYALNSVGVAYGDEISFTTLAEPTVPIVNTIQVTDVTPTSARIEGNVTDSGGADVIERGVCWGTNENPTISGNHVSSGTGTGSFVVDITGLTENTTYYVRAYATNSVGPAYGDAINFTTSLNPTVPTVITNDVSNITTTTATCGGNVTYSGNGTVTARGVCWSTSQDPTISDSHTTNGTGTGTFGSSITGLTQNTTYYVRAYATNEAGTAYGENKEFKTNPEQPQGPTGAINGLFAVSSTQQVWFSQGNLQYIGSASTPYWKFADNQWDCLGTTTGQNSANQNKDRDLFCWGTSGYNHGAVCYQPWSTSTTGSDYYAYGSNSYNLCDQTGQADWGYNPISNGGNQPNQWRTLTKDEWVYVFNTRSTPSGIRYAKAKVNNVNGVILLPDDWSNSYYSLSNTNSGGASYSSNTITASQWDNLEQHGAVFLPAAGYRSGTDVNHVGSGGRYWSAAYYGITGGYACNVYFDDTYFNPMNYDGRGGGQSVRLVSLAEK